MGGSVFGKNIKVMTFGESHGAAVGAVVDGIPSGLSLCRDDIQEMLDRRRPGKNDFSTKRNETDEVEILSGVFEGKTLGTPIAMMVKNNDAHSSDYDALKDIYRPGHADFTFDAKYAFRDHRGGGRSSGRETIGRVMAGAVCKKVLKEAGIKVSAYTRAIGPITAIETDLSEALSDPLFMPDHVVSERAAEYILKVKERGDSVGGVVECRIEGLFPGIGETVFDKLDAVLSKAVMSIGAVKGFEIGEGFNSVNLHGSEDNDPFFAGENQRIEKKTNHSGGTLGGMSDGAPLIFRAAIKPTPSISIQQETVNKNGENTVISIKGRHDPVIVPRAVVVVESMAAIAVLDLLISDMSSRIDHILAFSEKRKNELQTDS
ncbi:MAG: chorismate synthase [Lachnospiraceae bacterium]|nr:chorismate synthase [Lachnospiraceae bacterium]